MNFISRRKNKMATIYNEQDANLSVLDGKTIAVLGFGSQGHAHAMNLKDSGCQVVVGLKETSKSRLEAENYGLETAPVAEAVKKGDIIMVLLPDEVQGDIFEKEIKPGLSAGKMLMFAHGFSVVYSQVSIPHNIDVTMIAPKSPGHLVRREFNNGRGVPALLAIHQDYSGQAKQLSLAYGCGIGSTRAGVVETSFEEETETDLFGEQAVLCGGVTSLMKAGYDTLVEAGYQPEMAYFECINELKLIVDLIYEGGFSTMRYSVSNTAEYGDYITQDKLITRETKQKMREILEDIRSGRFARQWILENKAGQPSFKAMRRNAAKLPLESVGHELRNMMPWLKNDIDAIDIKNRPGPHGELKDEK
jgi:ketol-acid reductoisomerase